MVGLLLVGHSGDMVRGLLAMIAQAAPTVPAAGAGGLGDGRLGTDGLAVAAALREVLGATGEDGVLALLDLGSASLALDLALDEVGDDLRRRVRITGAPFVEGAVLAALAAASGAGIAAVAEAAERAPRVPKLVRD